MADALDLLAASLLRDQESYKTEDPFYSAGVGLDQVLQTAPAYHLKPWQSILAGVLGGFGSGVLKGIGTASADQKASSIATKLATALQAAPEDRAELFKDIPDGAKYGALLEVQDVQDKIEAKKARQLLLEKLATQDPKIFQVQQGTQNITMQRDPLTGVVSQIGAGPKFAPRAETEVDPAVQPLFIKQLARSLGVGEDDPSIAAAAKDIKAVTALRGLDANADISERFKANKDQVKRQTTLFGYEPIDDSFQLSPTELDDLRNKVAATQEIKSKLEVLSDKDLTQIAGQDAQTQAALSASLFQAFRNKTGSGANLTANEKDLIDQMSPALAAGNLGEAIKRGLLGRDQKQFSKDLQGILQDGLDVEMFGRGLKRKTKSLDSYPASLRETMGVSSVTPASGASSTNTGTPIGTKATLKDGSTATWDGTGWLRGN